MNDLYKNKYLKYKNKYLNLKNQLGGEIPVEKQLPKISFAQLSRIKSFRSRKKIDWESRKKKIEQFIPNKKETPTKNDIVKAEEDFKKYLIKKEQNLFHVENRAINLLIYNRAIVIPKNFYSNETNKENLSLSCTELKRILDLLSDEENEKIHQFYRTNYFKKPEKEFPENQSINENNQQLVIEAEDQIFKIKDEEEEISQKGFDNYDQYTKKITNGVRILIAARYTLKNEKGSLITFSLKPTRHLNDYDLEFKLIKKDEDFDNEDILRKKLSKNKRNYKIRKNENNQIILELFEKRGMFVKKVVTLEPVYTIESVFVNDFDKEFFEKTIISANTSRTVCQNVYDSIRLVYRNFFAAKKLLNEINQLRIN